MKYNARSTNRVESSNSYVKLDNKKVTANKGIKSQMCDEKMKTWQNYRSDKTERKKTIDIM